MLWWQCSQIRSNSSSPEQSLVMWVFCFTENVKQLFLDAQTFPNPTHTSVVHRFIFSKPSSPIMVSEGTLREGMCVPSILGNGCVPSLRKIFFSVKTTWFGARFLANYILCFQCLKKSYTFDRGYSPLSPWVCLSKPTNASISKCPWLYHRLLFFSENPPNPCSVFAQNNLHHHPTCCFYPL